jgi:CO/xanthine dehydrogenase Mo-binding subunit
MKTGPIKTGMGLSVMLHGTGAARALPDPCSTALMINSDGTVNLMTAAADEGQGNRTVLAQVAAEILGIDFHDISVSETETEAIKVVRLTGLCMTPEAVLKGLKLNR